MSGTEKRTFSLPQEQAALENWLREEVAPTFDAVKSGAQKTHSVGDVFDEIRTRHIAQDKGTS